jgi:hypothetical protein
MVEYATQPSSATERLWTSLFLGGLAGGVLLGLVIPTGLFFYCAFVLHDIGGPLIWPIFVVVGGVVGVVLGICGGAIWLLVRSFRTRG